MMTGAQSPTDRLLPCEHSWQNIWPALYTGPPEFSDSAFDGKRDWPHFFCPFSTLVSLSSPSCQLLKAFACSLSALPFGADTGSFVFVFFALLSFPFRIDFGSFCFFDLFSFPFGGEVSFFSV